MPQSAHVPNLRRYGPGTLRKSEDSTLKRSESWSLRRYGSLSLRRCQYLVSGGKSPPNLPLYYVDRVRPLTSSVNVGNRRFRRKSLQCGYWTSVSTTLTFNRLWWLFVEERRTVLEQQFVNGNVVTRVCRCLYPHPLHGVGSRYPKGLEYYFLKDLKPRNIKDLGTRLIKISVFFTKDVEPYLPKGLGTYLQKSLDSYCKRSRP